ncbi:uncharacterized protein BT62DRAFT_933835 [Guyanagaster necrorhizus]|uniref:Uncharacterized protein n=1 Tax=Guyanagaster necrorhizus TaxID=856835 RepID=A0A9P8ASE5_9AGAR|nr:uncharacterized protein BT62DRAFT_933835 [Guyanagaster necrorhizus MCA 3950]KAG7444787.1 hypothetical protein BT62DRAFT_933835 [Guyanagaster necrorhizus MCA 3950]
MTLYALTVASSLYCRVMLFSMSSSSELAWKFTLTGRSTSRWPTASMFHCSLSKWSVVSMVVWGSIFLLQDDTPSSLSRISNRLQNPS